MEGGQDNQCCKLKVRLQQPLGLSETENQAKDDGFHKAVEDHHELHEVRPVRNTADSSHEGFVVLFFTTAGGPSK